MTRKEFIARALVAPLGLATIPALAGTPKAEAPKIPSGRVSIDSLGAVAGSPQPCTDLIQRVIDQLSGGGGGTVVIPPGAFVTGTLRLRSGVHLELESGAHLLGSLDIADYPRQLNASYKGLENESGSKALIYADNEENIGIFGRGTIDGRGHAFAESGEGRPRVIQFVSCRGVRMEGIELRNSATWMQHYLNCENVQIRGLTIWNHVAKNNDMMDLDGCRLVTVSDCIGDSDDDGITLKSTGPAPCENITITNCVVSSHCNAIKCGTESSGGFKNIAISNCVVKPSAKKDKINGNPAGLSGLSLEVVDGGVMEGIVVSNLAIEGTLVPLFVRLGNRGRPYAKDAPTPPVGTVRNIRISNVTARGAGSIGSSISGIPGHPVEDVTLSGIRIELAEAGEKGDVGREVPEKEKSYPEGKTWGRLPACGLYVRHARRVKVFDLTVVPAPGEPRPKIVSVDATDCTGLEA